MPTPGRSSHRCPRRTLRAALALAVAAASGCASLTGASLTIGTDWDPEVSFSALTSWDWLPAPPASDDLGAPAVPVADERVRAAVAAALEARGHPRARGAPSFWVHPLATVEDVVPAETRFYYSQVPPWMRDALRDTHAIEGQRGTLVVDLIDPATRLPFWRGVASGALDPRAAPAAREERLREAARRLLARFPPR
jgi:hypothetical protein